jgi:AcrR family transcriptional regulator
MPKSFHEFPKDSRLQIIIDKASVLFHEKGYRATSLDDIAKELGITKAAIYHYIESKEELLFIIYRQVFDSAFKQITEVTVSHLPPDEKLRQIIWGHINHVLIKNLPMFSIFFSMENELSSKYYKKVLDWKKQYNEIVENTVREGMKKGLIRDVYPPKLLVFAIIGMCSWLYKWYKPNGKWSGDNISCQFSRLFEEGCLQTQARSPTNRKRVKVPSMVKETDSTPEDLLVALKAQYRLIDNILDQLEQTLQERKPKSSIRFHSKDWR